MGPWRDIVKAGDVLGAIADPFGENEIDVCSTADGIAIVRSSLPLVHEGDAMFQIARHEGTQAVAGLPDAIEPEPAYEAGLTSELADDPRIV